MTEPLKIYSDFYSIDTKDYMGIIRFYESNSLLLDNKSSFQNRDDFNDYVSVVGQYVISLESLGKYSKTIKYADRLSHLIDTNAGKYCIKLMDFTPYWSILASKGRAHYNLKDYKNSILVFDKLLTWDTDNDNFKIWRDGAKSKKRNSINSYLYISAAILLVTEIFFGDLSGIPKIRFYMSGFGFLLILIALFNELFLGKILKWDKKK